MRACIRRDPLSSGARVEIESQGQRIVIGSNEAGSAAAVQVAGVDHFRDRTPMTVGAFTITPFVGEALSRDAYAVLIEADGVALLYAGELHSGAVQKLLTAPPAHVDALLMDGASVGWGMSTDAFPSEGEFEEKFVAVFRQTERLPLVWCSRQNVERIHTIYRACLRTDRQFIVDLSTAEALHPPGSQPADAAAPNRLRIFVSARQMRKRTRKQAPPVPDVAGATRIYTQELDAAAPISVMLFRPSLIEDLDQAKCLAGSRLIFARWLGYLEYEKANPVLEWLERHGIPLDQFQATGHAGVMELIRLRQAFGAAPVVPVRSRQPGRFDELFGGVQRRADGEWWEITPCRR